MGSSIDSEKVIKGIEHCLSRYVDGLCCDCPYIGEVNNSYIMKCKEINMRDALTLLKEQDEEIREKNQRIWELLCERDSDDGR